MSPTRHEVKEYKYKVDRYTEDHTREQVDEDIRRGLDAWTNTQMSNYLQLSGCPTLKFTQAKVGGKYCVLDNNLDIILNRNRRKLLFRVLFLNCKEV